MAKKPEEKVMLAEHVLEVRYVPSGSFLDVRGYVADYIRESGLFPHWKIDTNVVNFRDKPNKVEKEGAFAGFRNAGYLAYNPETRNYFVDRAGVFWRTLQKNEHYQIPPIERFGARTKVFLPSDVSFEEINSRVFHRLYTDTTREVLGGTEKDVQFIVELIDEGFDIRVSGGPIHEGEVKRYLSFESKEMDQTGLYVDLDFYRTKNVEHRDIPKLLRAAIDQTWQRVERLASVVGI